MEYHGTHDQDDEVVQASAYTWTAIHLNIPGMKEGEVAITSRQLLIILLALIAPELIIVWAVRQFF